MAKSSKTTYLCLQNLLNNLNMNKKYFFALDLGATSGRTII